MNTFHISIATIFTATFLSISNFGAESPNDFKCGPIDCDVLKNHPDERFLKMIANAQDNKDDMAHIAELREQFWETYAFDPNSKECDFARYAFGQALFEKDLHYLMPNVLLRVWAPNPHRLTGEQEDLPSAITDVLTGQVDGGIPRPAQGLFYLWVNATRDHLGRSSHNLEDVMKVNWLAEFGPATETYRKAMNLNGKEYQEYVMERDWAEFAAVGRVPAGYDNKSSYDVFLYFRAGNNSFRDANIIAAGMEQALGKDAVYAAAERVRTAPKTASGDLVQRDLGEPVKLGPGGTKMDDYDAPVPKGDVIGIYKNPCLALEILVTQDDDRRYLLYLLKHQYWKNAASIKRTNDEWTFAAALYQQLTIAFGEADVLEAAHAVRTATKRWISGGLMDAKALGATRSVPLEAFEDILARKNPKGFVRATLAFDQDLQTPQAVDAAYQNLIASSGEQTILATAQKIVADKPQFGYRLELADFSRTMTAPPAPEKPAEVLVDDPLYLGWKGFEAGAKASYATQIWVNDPSKLDIDHLIPGHFTERHTFTLRSITPDQALFWLTEIAYDADGSVHPPHDSEFAYPAKIRSPATPAPSDDGPVSPHGKRGAVRRGQPQAMRDLPAINAPVPGRLIGYTMPATGPVETGEEVLEIHGRKVATHWQSATYSFKPKSPYENSTLIVKVWTSDAVPTGLVRKTQDQVRPATKTMRATRAIEETWLESFEGTKPGVAVPDASVPATTAYVPPPVPGGSVAVDNVTPPPETKSVPPPQKALPPLRTPTTRPVRPVRGRPQQSPADAALQQRYRDDSARFFKAKGELNRFIRKQDRTFQLPADVSAARDNMETQISAAVYAMQNSNNALEEKSLRSLEDSVTVVENYLKQ